jgi:hypothetical protein
MAKYKCPTLGDCDKANSSEIFDRSPGEDLKCPGCGVLLVAQLTPSLPSGGKKMPLIAAAVAAFVLIAGGSYFYKKSSTTVTDLAAPPTSAVVAEPTTLPVPPPVPLVAKVLDSGLAPSNAETRDLRISGDAKLSQGDAAGAELASSKAAANEMLKLAIAKMGQGKLDEAEKELNDARIRNPKQPLVHYNMAILRLKQGKADDALKELEACFMGGFQFFDKMDQDSDFDGLRKDPRFVDLVAKYRIQTK